MTATCASATGLMPAFTFEAPGALPAGGLFAGAVELLSLQAVIEKIRTTANKIIVPSLFTNLPPKSLCVSLRLSDFANRRVVLVWSAPTCRRFMRRRQGPRTQSGDKSPHSKLRHYQQAQIQNSFWLSKRIVTGPSLTSSTAIVAWNFPVATFATAARAWRTKKSYNGSATSGGAAS